jgi:hypothetical protein
MTQALAVGFSTNMGCHLHVDNTKCGVLTHLCCIGLGQRARIVPVMLDAH